MMGHLFRESEPCLQRARSEFCEIGVQIGGESDNNLEDDQRCQSIECETTHSQRHRKATRLRHTPANAKGTRSSHERARQCLAASPRQPNGAYPRLCRVPGRGGDWSDLLALPLTPVAPLRRRLASFLLNLPPCLLSLRGLSRKTETQTPLPCGLPRC